MKRLIVFLSALLSTSAYAENFTADDKVLFFSTDVLIEVIERNFDKNLQLDVANKYIELMDTTTHSVSIADLTTICATGQLDNAKCRNFINDLFTTMDIGDTVKPFYWADYIPYRGDEPSNTFVPHMGFEQDTGIWTIRFPWMKEQNFRKQYPGVEHLGGISACTGESGTVHVADMSKNFSQNEQTGNNCWCKMTFPEESAWVYNKSGDTMAGGCERSCALECLEAIRGADESMRAAMFTAVKLNGSNEHGTIDKKTLRDEFKPCEFDWKNIGRFKTKPWIDYNENGWSAGGFDWMNSDEFQCEYPGVKQIRGIAAAQDFEDDRGHNQDGTWGTRFGLIRSNIIHQEFGATDCWCKMLYPEQSKWVLCNVIMDADRLNCNMFCASAFQHTIYHVRRSGIVEENSAPQYECIKPMFQSIGKK